MIQPRPPAPPSSTTHVDRAQLTAGGRAIYDAAYTRGYIDGLTIQQRRGGYDAGRRDGWTERVEQEHRAWASMARTIRALSNLRGLTYAEQHALPDGYTPRAVPSYAECMASWEQPRTAVA